MINICLITDIEYLENTATCVKSLYLSKNLDSEYKVYVLYDTEVKPITNEQEQEFLDKFKDCNHNFSVSLIKQSSKKYQKFNRDDFHVKAADLLKFDLMNIFTDLDRIIYFDSDILILNDLTELYNQEFDNNILIANQFQSPGALNFMKHLHLSNYFNAGMLLFNLDLLRKEGWYDKLIDMREHNTYVKRQKSLDQLTFNYCGNNRIKKCGYKWNHIHRETINLESYNSVYDTKFKSAYEILNNVNVIHFAGAVYKPWFSNSKANAIWKCCENNISIRELRLVKSPVLEEQTRNTIVFSFDHNLIKQFVVAAYSLLLSSDDVDIYCMITENVTLWDRGYIIYLLRKALHEKNFSLKFVLAESVTGNCLNNVYEVRNITQPAYYRLFINKMLPNYNRVIYSDVDVIFKKNVFDILNKQSNKPLMAVPAVRFQKDNYFNSGFLVINIPEYTKCLNEDKLKSLLKEKLEFQDQDVMNKLFVDNIDKVSPSYCFMPEVIGKRYVDCMNKGVFTKKEIDELDNPYIIHYAGVNKPWIDSKSRLADIWLSYKKRVIDSLNNDLLCVPSLQVTNYSRLNRAKLTNVISEFYLPPLVGMLGIKGLTTDRLTVGTVLRTQDLSKELYLKDYEMIKDVNSVLNQLQVRYSDNILLVEKPILNSKKVKLTKLDAEQERFGAFPEKYKKKVKIVSGNLFSVFSNFNCIEFEYTRERLFVKRLLNED